MFRRAAAAERTLVEVHSHLGADRAEFSPSDIHGLSEWVPQVRWRVGRLPYAAMVWDESSFDALAWAIEPGGEAEQVLELIVTGPESLAPDGADTHGPARWGLRCRAIAATKVCSAPRGRS